MVRAAAPLPSRGGVRGGVCNFGREITVPAPPYGHPAPTGVGSGGAENLSDHSIEACEHLVVGETSSHGVRHAVNTGVRHTVSTVPGCTQEK